MKPATSAPFLRACRREPTEYTPVWLMRQAGRFMAEYRALRARFGFLELCKNPEAAAEVTLLPVERLGVDAAIIFADILLPVEPMGVGLEFAKGEGPVIHRPVRGAADLAGLADVDPREATPFVFEAIQKVRKALSERVPLIGFAGAPFTVASYLIEGGASREYLHTKRLMHDDPSTWHALMERLVKVTVGYVNGQIAAGAQAAQLFDSWVGALSPADYREFVLAHTRAVIKGLTPGVPVIHFSTGSAGLLELVREAGGDVIGLDWRVDLADAWKRVGYDVAGQGDLDPAPPLPPARHRRPPHSPRADRGGCAPLRGDRRPLAAERADLQAGERTAAHAEAGGPRSTRLCRHEELAPVPARDAGGDERPGPPPRARAHPLVLSGRSVVGALPGRRGGGPREGGAGSARGRVRSRLVRPSALHRGGGPPARPGPGGGRPAGAGGRARFFSFPPRPRGG